MSNPCLQIGQSLVDLTAPTADMIDLDAIELNLWNTRRFSNNPKALVVGQHRWLVRELATLLGWDHKSEIAVWCYHHDDHEGIIGDIVGPIKRLISLKTDVIDQLEGKLDAAICERRGIPVPSAETRRKVHYFDKLAETLEWLHCLGYERQPWNLPVPGDVPESQLVTLVRIAQLLEPDDTPPRGLLG